VSVFVGALGSQSERAAIVPADGSSAAFRVGSLSVRAVSAGFLAGAELASLSSSGITFKTATGTLPATITNDTAGGIVATNSAGKQNRIIDSGGNLYIGQGGSLLMFGNTSGFTTIGTDAVASGNVTVKAGTYNVLGDTLTQTMSNKTLAGTTPFNRLQANQGTSVSTVDFNISTAATGLGSWGSTATIAGVTGNDTAGSIAILSNGTGQSLNAAFKFTFHDGAFAAAPVVMVTRGEGNPPSANVIVTSTGTTSVIIALNGTPLAGTTYIFYWLITGK
jgi:hypothetical protein